MRSQLENSNASTFLML